jgi:hypothetical protein
MDESYDYGLLTLQMNSYGNHYIGEGFISDGSTAFFNVYSGVSFKTGSFYSDMSGIESFSALRNMDNGYGVYYSGDLGEGYNITDIVGNVYAVNASGQNQIVLSDVGFSYYAKNPMSTDIVKSLQASNNEYVFLGNYKEGLFYYGNDHETGGTAGFLKDSLKSYTRGFYDIDGNLTIDLSEYDIVGTPEFTDGYCMLSMANPQGSLFYTIIDKKGTRMFEPRINPFQNQLFDLQCGAVVFKDRYNTKKTTTIIDTSGNIVAEIEGNVSEYREDTALVKDGNSIYYIDKTGKKLF